MEKYIQELNSFKAIKTAFIIEGNIDDIYPITDEGGKIMRYGNLLQLLGNVFDYGQDNSKYNLLHCCADIGFDDPMYSGSTKTLVERFDRLLKEEKRKLEDMNTDNTREPHSSNKLITNAEIIRLVLSESVEEDDKPIIVVSDNVSRLCQNSTTLTKDEEYVFSNLLTGIKNAFEDNKLILICEKANDVPSWVRNNCNIKIITIPSPNRTIRESYIKSNMDLTDTQTKCLLDYSNKMKLVELRQIYTLKTALGYTIEEAMGMYRYGYREDYWSQFKDKINNMDLVTELDKFVVGQHEAKRSIARALKKAVNGLNNLSSRNNAPKPILKAYFGGPTGTGKTALIKALAIILFGDDKAMARFNMAEFSQAGTEQRLIGSPPGYVGYGEQAELVQKIKEGQKLFLFDEWEKANKAIEKLLLSFMDDGIITSASGETVYAGDVMIFFTSNIGICESVTDPTTGLQRNKLNVRPEDGRTHLETAVVEGMKNRFQPEFNGRISDVIVYDYLSAEVAEKITSDMIETIIYNLSNMEKTIEVDDSIYAHFSDINNTDEGLEFGGRTINKHINDFENAIAEYLIDNIDVEHFTASYLNNNYKFEEVC